MGKLGDRKERSMKRLLDLIITIFGLIVFLPVLLFTVILVYIKIGRPIFFTQDRPGLNGKIFKIYKFRSMTNECDENGNLLSDDKRLNAAGKFIRTTSLDETPALWNVLKGDMSLIGPRPLLVEYLLLYSTEQARRHELKPGISGWAQVNGRNTIGWEDKFKLDVWYVDNHNLLLDFKIMYLSMIKVVAQKDINQSSEKTMTKFTGNKND